MSLKTRAEARFGSPTREALGRGPLSSFPSPGSLFPEDKLFLSREMV